MKSLKLSKPDAWQRTNRYCSFRAGNEHVISRAREREREGGMEVDKMQCGYDYCTHTHTQTGRYAALCVCGHQKHSSSLRKPNSIRSVRNNQGIALKKASPPFRVA